MIAKHVPMRTLARSNFAELVSYLTDAQDKTERLGDIRVTNCAAATLPAVIGEVLATQRQNTRAAGDKTFHLLVSFRPARHRRRRRCRRSRRASLPGWVLRSTSA